MLKCLAAVGTTNTDGAKKFNINLNMVAQCIEENELMNMLEEPSNHSVVDSSLKKNDSYKNLIEFHDRSVLRSKEQNMK